MRADWKQKLAAILHPRDLRTALLLGAGGAVAGVFVGLYLETALAGILSPECWGNMSRGNFRA